MVALDENTRDRWEAERERRELAELERLARLLLDIYGIGLGEDTQVRASGGMTGRST